MTDNFEEVNHLVLNFYPDGYSIAVKLNEFPVFTSETILETAKISYEETSLLDYIENEELPPLLVDMIDSSPKLSQYKIWHNGCLILEVRDKINPNFDFDINNINDNSMTATTNNISNKLVKKGSFFILLKPTNLSMLHDVLNLTGSSCWTAQDILQLESQIVLHNSPRLSLEPTITSKQLHELDLSFDSNQKSSNYGVEQAPSKLKSIYSGRVTTSQVNHNSANGDTNNHQDLPTTRTPPPELTLQQFLTTKRAKRNSFPIGQAPRFQRFRKHLR